MTPAPGLNPPTTTTLAATSRPDDRAICPGCHHVDSTMTTTALAGGAAWQCARCAQRWDVVRLTAVSAYEAWIANRAASV